MTRKRYQISHWNAPVLVYELFHFNIVIQHLEHLEHKSQNTELEEIFASIPLKLIFLFLALTSHCHDDPLLPVAAQLSNPLTHNYPLLLSGPSLCTDGSILPKIVPNIFLKW